MGSSKVQSACPQKSRTYPAGVNKNRSHYSGLLRGGISNAKLSLPISSRRYAGRLRFTMARQSSLSLRCGRTLPTGLPSRSSLRSGRAVRPAFVLLWRGSLRSPLRCERRLVREERVELSTFGSGGRRSIQLSYSRLLQKPRVGQSLLPGNQFSYPPYMRLEGVKCYRYLRVNIITGARRDPGARTVPVRSGCETGGRG